MELQTQEPTQLATGIRLDGTPSINMGFSRIELSMPAILNNREEGNVSGTLRIELWDVKQPYTGGDFEGEPLAGFTVGTLAAGFSYAACSYDLVNLTFSNTAARPVVMLREWNGVSYDTVAFHEIADRTEKAAEPAKKAAPAAKKEAAKTEAPEAKPEAKAEPKAKVEAKVAAKPAAKKAAKKKGSVELVSINEASVAEIAELKGVSEKLAAAIVAARPYTSPNELLRVKGMGVKLMTRIKDSIKL